MRFWAATWSNAQYLQPLEHQGCGFESHEVISMFSLLCVLSSVGRRTLQWDASPTISTPWLKYSCFREFVQNWNRSQGLVCKSEEDFFCSPILFAICTSTFRRSLGRCSSLADPDHGVPTSTFCKLCKRHIQRHIEECSVALPSN
jgi:hypothetical protein